MSSSPVRRAVGVVAVACAWGATALAAASPTVHTGHGCYLVGQAVRFAGSGFAPARSYEVAVDGVDFGQSRTDSAGALRTSLVPGGLPAGVPQSVEQLDISDGSSDAVTSFTLTRSAGARFLASRGDPRTLSAPFQLWGFALDGVSHTTYLHYVDPAGRERTTVTLGRSSGQCGYLVTHRVRVFPFSPSTGTWTLQIDTQPAYSSRPSGAVARISVRIARG
jgi:hypothetical protein